MRNTGLEEAQARIKIARRNINNLKYADDTPLMVESKEELNILLNMPANLEHSGVATGLELSVFIPILKKDNAKECSNYHTIALI